MKTAPKKRSLFTGPAALSAMWSVVLLTGMLGCQGCKSGADSDSIDVGDPELRDPDGSRSDIGAWGGPGADDWDLDEDGYPSWWQPGTYDSTEYPPLGLDCDDDDRGVRPGAGC